MADIFVHVFANATVVLLPLDDAGEEYAAYQPDDLDPRWCWMQSAEAYRSPGEAYRRIVEGAPDCWRRVPVPPLWEAAKRILP
jgi:hypothetical protein